MPLHKGILTIPDTKVHGANMGPTWGRQDPGGSHVDHVKLLSGMWSPPYMIIMVADIMTLN